MNIDLIIDHHRDAEKRAEALKEAQDDWVTAGGTAKTAQQAVNDTLGMRALEAKEDKDNTQYESILTTLYMLNQWIVKKTTRKHGNDEDIESAALTGLWIACTRFKPGRGSFYQYAQKYIHFEAAKAAAEGRYDSFYEYRNTPAVRVAVEDLERAGTTVTAQKVSQNTGLSEAVISRIVNPLRTVSGSTPLQEDNTETLIDTIPSPYNEDPEENAILNEQKESITSTIKKLTPNQQEVITRHYGLDGQTPEHLAEIVRRTGWRKQDVSRLHADALVILSGTFSMTQLRS